MQSEQKVKVGLIKSAIKLSSAIKLLHVAINQKSQNGLRQQQQVNESVNMFHYCMITREKIKSQNNRYKLDLNLFLHFPKESHKRPSFNESKRKHRWCKFMALPHVEHADCMQVQEHILGNLVTKDPGAAVAHLQCCRTSGCGRGQCQSESIKLSFPLKAMSSPPCGTDSFKINPNWLHYKTF